MKSIRRLIDALSDGAIHSGEALGEGLGITRAGVWKLVQRANAEMLANISVVPSKGYFLVSPVEWFDAVFLNENGRGPVAVIESCTSTNDLALQGCRRGECISHAWVAEHQTSGRGRRGKSWISGLGASVCMSIASTVSGGVQALEGLSLAIGISVAQTLNEAGYLDVQVKWPNDILIGGAKVAGILVEIVGDPLSECSVVVGLGVNVRSPVGAFGYPVTGLEDHGPRPGRNAIARSVYDAVVRVLVEADREGFSGWLSHWDRFDYLKGKDVVISTGFQTSSGTCLGVNQRGALLVLINGSLEEFYSGEVSVRPNE